LDETELEASFEIWRERRASGGPYSSLADLYQLVANARGQTVEQLTSEERAQIWALAAPVIEPGFEVIPHSERDETDPVDLVPYDSEWPRRFEVWKERLSGALRPKPTRIDHVGSTAIPDLPAKPVVDIQISVEDIRDESAYVPAIESIGVQFRSRDNQRRYFRPFSGQPREVQIHVCNSGSKWEARHLLFRDFLRADDAAKSVYVDGKLDDQIPTRRRREGRLLSGCYRTVVLASARVATLYSELAPFGGRSSNFPRPPN
jgi:GrpB-like predicted nucleotidyltransferase (UPF0157 family)